MSTNPDEQLRLARLVQDTLLPPPLTDVAGLELSARFQPSARVGGDFIDYFPLGVHRLGFYLGDVQGKGLEAALYALLISGLMRGLHKTGVEPAAVLHSLNRRLSFRSPPGKFCCLAYGVFDVEQSCLLYSSAGLPFPVLLRDGRVSRIELTGTPVGLFNPSQFDQVSVELQAGDRFLFFTDGAPDALLSPSRGISEAEAELGELFRSIGKRPGADPAEALLECLRSIQSEPASPMLDDITFLAAHVL